MTAPALALAELDGDDTHINLCLIVAPVGGTYRPRPGERRHRMLAAGSIVGHIDGPGLRTDVASFRSAAVVRALAHDGERVRPGQPLLEVRPVPHGATDESADRAAPTMPLRFGGLGSALPATVVTNDDLPAHLETSDRWITERTGIRARHVARTDVGETTTALATGAADRALQVSGLAARDIDLVVVATATPDSPCPSTASRVAAALGIESATWDLNGACCGFVHALHTVGGLLTAGSACAALVIGADRFTSLLDPDDRSTAVLFGDGAGAAVVTSAPGAHSGILAADLGGAPSALDVLEVPLGQPHLHMDGPELYRRASRGLATSAITTLAEAGVDAGSLDLWIPHQANSRIISAAAKRIGLEPDQVVVDLAHRANTSAASIPLALDSASDRLTPGTLVLLSAIGAGLDWTSLLVRWS